MLVSRRPEPLWPTTSLVEWGCEGSGRRQSANSPAEQQRWSWSIRYGSILAGRIAVTEHIAGPRPGTVVPALAAGGRVMPTQAWLLGGPLGWIVAVTGGSPGRFMDGLGASGAVCPLGGGGAAAPQGALCAIDAMARPRFWRTFGPRRLRQSQACPGCHEGDMGAPGLPSAFVRR
jgi:hypothetical protein